MVVHLLRRFTTPPPSPDADADPTLTQLWVSVSENTKHAPPLPAAVLNGEQSYLKSAQQINDSSRKEDVVIH